MARARFTSLNVIVDDVDGLARFLDALGVALQPAPPDWAVHHRSYTGDEAGFEVEFDSPAFARWWGAVPRDGAPRAVVNIGVESRQAVDELHRRAVGLGAEEVKPPSDAFWGARYSVVAAPGPLLVGFIEATRRRAPDCASGDRRLHVAFAARACERHRLLKARGIRDLSLNDHARVLTSLGVV